jgi:hypothetical protein
MTGYEAVRRYAWRWSKARGNDCHGICAAEPCTGRRLPVRLEPRGRRLKRGDGDREGRPFPALSQPNAVCAFLSARDPGDGLRRARPGCRLLQGRMPPRHLRQHEARSNRSSPRRGGRARSNWCDKAGPIHDFKSTKSVKLAHSGNEKRNVLRTRCLRSRGKRFSWSPSIAIA